jgi:hypothetical protein
VISSRRGFTLARNTTPRLVLDLIPRNGAQGRSCHLAQATNGLAERRREIPVALVLVLLS